MGESRRRGRPPPGGRGPGPLAVSRRARRGRRGRGGGCAEDPPGARCGRAAAGSSRRRTRWGPCAAAPGEREGQTDGDGDVPCATGFPLCRCEAAVTTTTGARSPRGVTSSRGRGCSQGPSSPSPSPGAVPRRRGRWSSGEGPGRCGSTTQAAARARRGPPPASTWPKDADGQRQRAVMPLTASARIALPAPVSSRGRDVTRPGPAAAAAAPRRDVAATQPAPVVPRTPSGPPPAIEGFATYVPAVSCDTRTSPAASPSATCSRRRIRAPRTASRATGFRRAVDVGALTTAARGTRMISVRTAVGKAGATRWSSGPSAKDAKDNPGAQRPPPGRDGHHLEEPDLGAYSPTTWRPYSSWATNIAPASDRASPQPCPPLPVVGWGDGAHVMADEEVAAQCFGPCRVPDSTGLRPTRPSTHVRCQDLLLDLSPERRSGPRPGRRPAPLGDHAASRLQPPCA